MTTIWLSKPFNKALYVTHVQFSPDEERIAVDPPVRLKDFLSDSKK